MSGAVKRFCAGWFGAGGLGVGWIDMSGSECGGAEHHHTNYERMEYQAERQIQNGADDDRGDIVLASAQRNRQPAGIAAVLERDAVIDRPGQHRAEQDDAAEIAIGEKMRYRPQ